MHIHMAMTANAKMLKFGIEESIYASRDTCQMLFQL